MANSSRFKDFVTFLASIRGDLANVTAPPFFLAPQSFLEGLKCFTERPLLFAAPAAEEDAAKRAMLVTKWWLASLKSAFYVGNTKDAGIRKPLNPFLGELWFGSWADETNTADIVVEQVSHHPPITACYMSDKENGVHGQGYTRVEMTFSGYLNVRQTGHAVLHIDRFDEDYLIPLPSFQVRGFMGGKLYPDISAVHHVISSSGYTTKVHFSGRGLFSGVKNSFSAKIYRSEDPSQGAVYTFEGLWNERFDILHVPTGVSEQYLVDAKPVSNTICKNVTEQDSWESRKAWGKVHDALRKNDMQATMQEKGKLEQAQREMRKNEKAANKTWQPTFFSQLEGEYPLFKNLRSDINWQLQPERTKGVWKFDHEKARKAQAPYHGDLTPFG